MRITIAPVETPPAPRGAPKGETDILRAAEHYYAAHNAWLAGRGSLEAVSAAEDALNAAIWGHHSPTPDFARKMKP